MDRLKWFSIVLMIIIFGFPLSLAAQEQPEETYRLSEVVISASRIETPTFDTPQSVTVVSSEEIMASPFERFEDILMDTVGYEATSHYGTQRGGIRSHFSLRGVGPKRTLLLVDGVPLNDNFNNSILWVAKGVIPKEIIERIEIVRGPTSATYGSEGLGGVIHIITKKPSENKEGSVSLTAGTAETYKGSGLYSQKSGNWGGLVSGEYETSDGLYMYDPEDIVGKDYIKRRYRDIGKVFGKVTYELGERTDIDFSALFYDHETGKGWDNFYDDAFVDQYRLSLTNRGESMDWSAMVFLNRADKTANIAYKNKTRDLKRKENFPGNETWGTSLQNTARLQDRFTITSGLDYKRTAMDYDEDHFNKDQTISNRDSGASGRQETIAPFMDMTGHFFNDKLIVNAGLRYTSLRNFDGRGWDTDPPNMPIDFNIRYDSKTWDDFSPKAGVVFHPDTQTVLRASMGTGFRAPTIFELYKSHSRGDTSITWANPKLDPEEITTWDVGAERRFFNRLDVSLAYYHSEATDYIGSRKTDSYPIIIKGEEYTYTESMRFNLQEVDIQGVEAVMKYDFGHGLAANLNYTYNVAEIVKDKKKSLVGNYVSGMPRHKYKARLTYRNPSLISGSVSVRHKAHIYADNENTEKSDDYTSVDFSLWRTFFDKLTLRLNIENLTDEGEYLEDGTLYYGTVEYKFF